MEYLKQQIEARQQAWAAAKSLLDAAAAEKRELTAEEEQSYSRMMADIDERGLKIKDLQAAEQRAAEIEAAVERAPEVRAIREVKPETAASQLRSLLNGEVRSITFERRDLSTSIARGDVRTMSFGFSTVKDAWSADGQERTLNEVRLHEVSVVTGVAAYPATTASVRNLRALAFRTETDADALADAISALESGAELSDSQADVLLQVVDRSRPAADPLPEPTVPLSILQKQIDLWGKNL